MAEVAAAGARPYTIGLTGGVASGKTFVAARFIEMGVPLLEADEVARAVVVLGEPALAQIAADFGRDFLMDDGTLDRRRLRERVFGDTAARLRLEAITHPHIRARIREWQGLQTAPYVILSAAILIESGMDALVDRVLLIDVPEAVQIERLVDRDGIAAELGRQMLAAQAPRARRLARADDVIDNRDADRDLRPSLRRLDALYRERAAARTS